MARSRSAAFVPNRTAELAAIETYYRERLTAPIVPRVLPYEPVVIGPTWRTTPDGTHWDLPEATLGWSALAWSGMWLQHKRDSPWKFTDEQARFLLWWYALDESGEFLYRDGVLQRLKGWGKDPLGACICGHELVGPCRFDYWDGDRPVGRDVEDAWVQTAAVSLKQTKNTMRLLPRLFTAEAVKHYGLQIGKEQVHAVNGERLLEAVTSSPTTLEGARATFVLPNETQHWNESNSGHEMAAVIERNATKSADGAARTLRITNAYEPGMDSVAERDRDAYEAVASGKSVDSGLLYDSLEAPPEAPLTLEDAPAVVESVRGDSVWLNVVRIVKSIADPRNPPSRSRRFWYNQITAAEDALLAPHEFDALGDPEHFVPLGTEIVMFFDGSKSDDATGLVGCVLATGFVFQLGVWQRPAGLPADQGWIVDRADVDLRVREVLATYKVRAFWADPSDTRDDDGERFWAGLIDGWHRDFKDSLQLWAVKTSDRQHSIEWDMRSPGRLEQFTYAVERFVADVKAKDFAHCESAALKQHVKNARRRPNRYGVGLGKEHRESARKVDLAVCAVGARMLRRLVLNKGVEKQRTGRVW